MKWRKLANWLSGHLHSFRVTRTSTTPSDGFSFGQGEAAKAIAYLGAANLSAPRDPDIQYHLAVALDGAGRPADAQAMLETLLRSGASFADRAKAEKLLRELKPG